MVTNSTKVAKDTDFKFGTHPPRQSPDMTAEKRGRGQGHVTTYLAEICTLTSAF